MSDAVIAVENLSKRYLISHLRQPGREGLRHVLEHTLMAPVRFLQRLTSSKQSAAGNAGAPVRVPSTIRDSNFEARNSEEQFWALKDISFEVKQGEVLGIIGRNGAGKSTLLKILSRITEPTTGRIRIKGRVASLLEVGTGFHPELTGRENIFLNGAILGMSRAEIRRKFDEIVAFSEVEKFIDTPVKRYSSGMYVRLAFAVAAHLEPEILIVDEVLAVGDIAFQKKCLGKMGDVASRYGRTVLFVSHNMAAIRSLCSRAVLIKTGSIDMMGEIESVISRYLSANAAEMSTVVELPPPAPDTPARGTVLRTLTLEGAAQAQFRIGEPWKIRLEFELSRDLGHVIAAVGMINLESVPLITYWSTPKDLAAGRYTVEFHCHLPLSACDLNFVVGISTNEKAVYYVEGVGHVSISEIAVSSQPVRSSGTGLLSSPERPEILKADPAVG